MNKVEALIQEKERITSLMKDPPAGKTVEDLEKNWWKIEEEIKRIVNCSEDNK